MYNNSRVEYPNWTLKFRLVSFFLCLFVNVVVTSSFVIGWALEHNGIISKQWAACLMSFYIIIWVVWNISFIVGCSFRRPWGLVSKSATRT